MNCEPSIYSKQKVTDLCTNIPKVHKLCYCNCEGRCIMEKIEIGLLFGERLREKRMEFGLKQEEVARWFKMKKSAVSQWESGRLPHATIIIELARRFNVTTDWLLGCDTIKATTPNSPTIELPDDLPPEAIYSIKDYIDLIRLKYKKPAPK